MSAQKDSLHTKKLTFNGDIRFRIEQDWNSRKSDGSYRDNRTRYRYRARFGATYKHKDWVSLGFRLRTGDPKKQQDPHLTIGDEFNSFPIAFDKVYAKFDYKWFSSWIGKNSFPFEKQNELFWSDNVNPEGVSISGKFKLESSYLQALQINAGHFIVSSKETSTDTDSYFQGIQLVTSHWGNKLKLFPALYYFKNIPNIPDGEGAFDIDYAIVHLGSQVSINKKPLIIVGFDFLQNIKNYENVESISSAFTDQKKGYISAINIGELKKSGDWKIGLTYTYLERYAAVDFFAQNDWVRWDYSSENSNDGRLTNFKGIEMMGAYAIDSKINLKVRFFAVDQIIALGTRKENGNRIRLDFNMKF